MASVSWKGSILDTYEKNTTFGGRSGESAKDADKQAVDFIKPMVGGKIAVNGFIPHMTKDKSGMVLDDDILITVRTHSAEKSTYAIGKKYSQGVNK